VTSATTVTSDSGLRPLRRDLVIYIFSPTLSPYRIVNKVWAPLSRRAQRACPRGTAVDPRNGARVFKSSAFIYNEPQPAPVTWATCIVYHPAHERSCIGCDVYGCKCMRKVRQSQLMESQGLPLLTRRRIRSYQQGEGTLYSVVLQFTCHGDDLEVCDSYIFTSETEHSKSLDSSTKSAP
jgi:hypothetical protein